MNRSCLDIVRDEQASDGFLDIPSTVVNLASGVQIVAEGQSARKAYIIEEGWAMRYTLLADGRRQILNFMLPGDFFDLHVIAGEKSDHSVETITPVRARLLDPADILKHATTRPDLLARLCWSSLQEEGILRAQIIRNGRRTAVERIAHLVLELGRRLKLAGQFEGQAFRLPLTQTVMADALGLSNVHVSRSLKRLRQLKLLDVRGGWARILDADALAKLADFHPSYLHRAETPPRLQLIGAAQV